MADDLKKTIRCDIFCICRIFQKSARVRAAVNHINQEQIMKQATTLMKGSEITIKCLELLGVEVVFAYPGGQAIELHQALSRSSLRVIA